ASKSKDVDHRNCADYFRDNVFLTETVLSIPCKKFIYISTVDVYPQSSHSWKEDDKLIFNTGTPCLGLYGTSKFVSESLVVCSPNWLILRCAVLLNKYSRTNTIKRILDTSEHHNLFVSGASEYNFVLASDLAKFIEMAISNDLQGIYNVASSDYVRLDALVKEFNSDVTFSDYVYRLGKVNNRKICGVAPFFDKSTLEAVRQFSQEL
ncbi:hypothetical protein LCGC14_2735250, partial [marine sediment metagenome]